MTLCSTYLSMNTADQRNTITTMLRQNGDGSAPPSDEVSETELSARDYCLDTRATVDENISGYIDSAPP